MTTTVLYDPPGPKTRRRIFIGTVVATLALLAARWYAAFIAHPDNQVA